MDLENNSCNQAIYSLHRFFVKSSLPFPNCNKAWKQQNINNLSQWHNMIDRNHLLIALCQNTPAKIAQLVGSCQDLWFLQRLYQRALNAICIQSTRFLYIKWSFWYNVIVSSANSLQYRWLICGKIVLSNKRCFLSTIVKFCKLRKRVLFCFRYEAIN